MCLHYSKLYPSSAHIVALSQAWEHYLITEIVMTPYPPRAPGSLWFWTFSCLRGEMRTYRDDYVVFLPEQTFGHRWGTRSICSLCECFHGIDSDPGSWTVYYSIDMDSSFFCSAVDDHIHPLNHISHISSLALALVCEHSTGGAAGCLGLCSPDHTAGTGTDAAPSELRPRVASCRRHWWNIYCRWSTGTPCHDGRVRCESAACKLRGNEAHTLDTGHQLQGKMRYQWLSARLQ